MLRVALWLGLLFALLAALRVLRALVSTFLPPTRAGGGPAEEEMVRDPVCGTWIDRTLALAGRRGEEWVPVCSEKCRKLLEAG